jgi:hypothetical protein
LEAELPPPPSPQPAPPVRDPLVTDVHYTRDGLIALSGSRVALFLDPGLITGGGVFISPALGQYSAFSTVSVDGDLAALIWSVGAGPGIEVQHLGEDAGLVLENVAGGVDEVVLSPDGSRLVARYTRYNDPRGALTYVFATDTGAEVWHSDRLEPPFVFSPDRRRLYAAVAGDALSFVGVDADTGTEVVHFRGGSNGLSISPDGRRLITVSRGGAEPAATIWRTSDGLAEQVVVGVSNYRILGRMAGSPDGSWAGIARPITGEGGAYMLLVWGADGKLRYQVPLSEPLSERFLNQWIAFSPAGTEILTASIASIGSDAQLHLFRASDGARVTDRKVSVASLQTGDLSYSP